MLIEVDDAGKIANVSFGSKQKRKRRIKYKIILYVDDAITYRSSMTLVRASIKPDDNNIPKKRLRGEHKTKETIYKDKEVNQTRKTLIL